MAERKRDYQAEYRRRNELARSRGFKSYGQQRRYTQKTGERAEWISHISPEAIAEVSYQGAYGYDDYLWGEDKLLDAWIRRSENRGVSEYDAYLTYKRRARGGSLSRSQIQRLSRDIYGEDWDEKWSSS